ncbi:MAG TPA: FAD-dependent oxidoreductase [Rubrivivax sp.]|nr:FAD-dependent oxidoreductase [Burkholderiales bacterium]HNT39523.1 FAD-dependent oxidoreductase [Rubrivivax sp.]
MSETANRDIDYQKLEFDYHKSPDQSRAQPAHHPVVVVGAGPVGLTLAIDLAQRGQRVLLLDDDHRLSTGSRAICFAKRTLEIWDRVGVGQRMVDKGVSWNVGRVFFRDQEVYRFDLLPEPGHERPAFINLQQYYAEGYLAERAAELPNLEIRWKNKVTALTQDGDRVTLTVDTPDGPYEISASYVAACDGSRSPLRGLLGQESKGRIFRDRFLIADLQLAEPLFPNDATERWYWFDPPFHRGQSVLLHKQADHVWRIDFQLGWDADPDEERKPERILPRVQALLRQGFERDVPFTLAWASIYTFACLRMDRFRHGRVLFAGDSAHGVSPFGARGANSGVQDAENLAWKIDAVLRGRAPDALLDSYAGEREYAADENILNSTRATDFITPKSEVSRIFRDAVLGLAREYAFARSIVNSGRLSVPATLDGSVLNTADVDGFTTLLRPGAVAADAPLSREGRATWLLRELGPDFTLLVFGAAPAWAAELGVQVLAFDGNALHDAQGLAAQRYDAAPGTAYLIRPDHHIAARWRAPTAAAVRAALDHALAKA